MKVLTIGSDPNLRKPGGIVTHMRLLCSLEVFGEIEPLDVGSVHGTAALGGVFPALRVMRNLARLRLRLQREAFDVIMIHQPASNSAMVKLAMTLVAIPRRLHNRVLVFFHGGRFETIGYLNQAGAARVFRKVFGGVRGFYFLSRPERTGFEAIFPDLPSAYFANYSDSDDTLARIRAQDDRMRLLFVGRVDRIKGVFAILDALEELVHEHGMDAHLTVVGTGPDLEELKGQAEARVPGHVAFAGFLQGELLEAQYRAADLFVMPTLHPEGFPYVVIESMRAGLPLITTDEGILETLVVDGETGFLVPPEDPRRLAEVILKFRDRALLERITANNYAYFEGHMRRERAEEYYGALVRSVVGEAIATAAPYTWAVPANLPVDPVEEDGVTRRDALLRYFLSMYYTRPSQLFWRARLYARRWWADRGLRRLARRVGQTEIEGLIGPDSWAALPGPIFAARTHLSEPVANGMALTIWGQRRVDRPPVDWNRSDLEHARLSWLFNLHYMEYLEAFDDARFEAWVMDWIEQNPITRPGSWRYAWHSYCLSIRVVVWMQQLALRHERLSESTVRAMLASIVEQLHHLESNLERDVLGNHLLKNIKALLWGSTFFQGDEARQAGQLAAQMLDSELDEQILADGGHYERSPTYGNQVFADLLECYHVLEAGPTKTKLERLLPKIAQAAVDLTHPDGLPSLFNDGGLHMTYATSECLEVWGRLTGGTVEARRIFALEDTGYFGYRGELDYVLVDCGPVSPDYLPGHAHGDILSFEWSVGNQRVFVDAGVFNYDAGERRQLSRSTRLHNTVLVDGQDQCVFWGSHRMARRARVQLGFYEVAEHGFSLTGSHTGYISLPGRPIHERTYHVADARVEIEDRIDGGAGQSVEARLLLHPDARVERWDRGVEIYFGETVLRLTASVPVAVEEAVWFPDFGIEEACVQLVLVYGIAPLSGGFVIERLGRPADTWADRGSSVRTVAGAS